MKKSSTAVAAILTLILVFASGCGGGKSASTDSEASGKKTIKIAYLPLTHALAVLAAKDLSEEGKIDANVNVELVKFSSWPELTDALNADRVDGASVLIELAAKAKEQGIDLKVVALGHHNGNAVIVKPEINSAANIKGKTLAVPHRQSSHNILVRQMLSDAELSLSDVNLVELPPPEMPSALAQGTIDGYCVAEPFGAKAVTMNIGKALRQSDELWKNSICCGLVLNNAYLKAHPDAAREFVEQYKQAGHYLSAHPEAAMRVAKNHLAVDEETLELSLKWISFDDLQMTKDSYDTLTEKMVKFGLTDHPPKYEDFVASGLTE
ncbi:MAG: ABC transporter substrate-binding protein [Planctomycetaceae bacterium]|nr:ABC transporter substrate-binding protein [Planctomycetaceae bacterium]